jgi:TrmH family RNA methyltransferase
VDDTRDLIRALACGYRVDYALYCPALGAGEQTHLPTLPSQLVYEVTIEMLEKAGYRANPSPYVAVMHSKPPLTIRDLPIITMAATKQLPPILALVNLQKPGNIGALLRSADAAGFKRVFLIDTALDLYNPNIIRSSTGACFLENVYRLTTPQALDYFHREGYQVIAAHLGGNLSLYEVEFQQAVALVLGTEDVGLDTIWVEHSDALVKIPMVGSLSDSLNVSVSGAVLMYEVLRQHLTQSKIM